MTATGLIIWLIIGAVARLAGQIMKGSGYGLAGDIAVVIGAAIANYILPRLGFSLAET